MKRLNKAQLRQRHLDNLVPILGVTQDEIKVVYKQLKDLEHKGHKASERYCNGEIDSNDIDEVLTYVRTRLKDLIRNTETLKNIHLNTDPRGYFLKLDDDYVRPSRIQIETDWGGYGILCPNEGES